MFGTMVRTSGTISSIGKSLFPAFNFELNGNCIASDAGYICWSDLHKIYDIDVTMDGNLRKALKLTYQSLHPGNKKQSVILALSIFDETTIASSRCYFLIDHICLTSCNLCTHGGLFQTAKIGFTKIPSVVFCSFRQSVSIADSR